MSLFVGGGGIIPRLVSTLLDSPIPTLGRLPTLLACGRPELVLLAVEDGESMLEASDDKGR